MRPTKAIIDLDALSKNYVNLRERVNNRPLIAVVKADAYGHGMLQCVKKLSSLETPPEYYGVALLEEAVELADSNITDSKILCFAPFEIGEINTYTKKSIIPTVCTVEQIDEIKNLEDASSLVVHVNIDTGMGRLGIPYSMAQDFILELSKTNITVDGVYTHFATSDEKDKEYANLQLKRFLQVKNSLHSNGLKDTKFHCANSGAVIDMPESWLDMVRPGISLYGYYPSEETSESVELKPVMSIQTKVSTIREVQKGESVSYGRKYFATKNILAGTIPLGYADGISRALSNKISVIINNKLYDQIGRVTMDRILVKVDEAVTPGDDVLLLGSTDNHIIDACDWASILDTIPYEVTCNISKRVPRFYINE